MTHSDTLEARGRPHGSLYRDRPAEILLVDDSRGDALLAQRAFAECKISTAVTIASTGEMALEILRGQGEYADRRLPDIILLDLRLPRMSGAEVLTAIKEDIRFKHIPVIVLSSSGAGEIIMQCYRSHANAYLVKPGDMAQYRSAIEVIERFYLVTAALPAGADD